MPVVRAEASLPSAERREETEVIYEANIIDKLEGALDALGRTAPPHQTTQLGLTRPELTLLVNALRLVVAVREAVSK